MDDKQRIEELTAKLADAERRLVVESSTYGDIARSIQELIEPHHWDNKTASEQRDWLLGELHTTLRNLDTAREALEKARTQTVTGECARTTIDTALATISAATKEGA